MRIIKYVIIAGCLAGCLVVGSASLMGRALTSDSTVNSMYSRYFIHELSNRFYKPLKNTICPIIERQINLLN